MSIVVCLLMITSISAPITQNVGQPQNLVQSGPSPTSGGSGGLADSPWPMFRQNLNHTGVSPYDTSANPGTLKWSFKTGGRVTSSAAIGLDGTIYIGSEDNNLYAINPDGTEKWSFLTDNWVWPSPAIGSDGTIYVGSFDNKLYAINPDGTEKWNFTTNYPVRSSPVIGPDGTIYFGSDDNKLYGINPDGTEKWSFTTSFWVRSSPAIDFDGTIYVGSEDHNLYAINPGGSENWNFMTGDDVPSSPTIGSDGTVYIGSADNKLYAINPDGTGKWNFTTGYTVYSSPAIGSDGTIYIGSYDDRLYAINSDGTEKWNFTTGGNIHSSPVLGSDGTIYVGSDDQILYSINSDGTEKWNFTTMGIVFSSPSIDSDGTIYVGSYDGNLYAIGNPNLEIEVTSHFTTLNSAAQSAITVHVTDGTDPVQGATVNLVSDNGGIFSPQSGITDANGDFKSIFNAPTVTTQIICRISAEASKSGYNDGSGYVDVTINPIPWPMFRQNLNRTGVSPYDTSSNPGKLKWSFMTSGHIHSSPAIGSDETIYVGSGDNKLYAINPDGTEKWNFSTGGWLSSSPTIGFDGTIYIGSYDDKLYAINPDGTEKWNFTTGADIQRTSATIGSDGTIYIGSQDNKLYAINPDGTLKWSFITGGSIHSSPTIGPDGTIFIGSYDDKVYAINPNGTEKWSFMSRPGLYVNVYVSAAIGSNGIIYIGSGDSYVYALYPNGSKKWDFFTDEPTTSSPAIDIDDTIYIGSYDGNLYAINPDGTEKWKFQTGEDVWSSPAIGSDGTIYFGSEDNNIYAMNPNGTEKWNFTTDYYVHSSPAIGSDGTIYIGSGDYKLYAIGTSNKTQHPIANAGPDQTVNEGDIVQFDGSASDDPYGSIQSYHWDFGDGNEYTSTGTPPTFTQVTTNPNVDVDPRWNPQCDKIVFESTRSDYKRDLWTIDRDGTNPQKLTGDIGWYERFPAWSPDGTQILYSRGLNDGSYQNYDLWVVNADGTNPHAIRSTSIDERLGDWTPDGNNIVFIGMTTYGNYDVYIMNANGSNPIQLTNNSAWDTHARVSPDSTKIAFMSGRTGSSEIWVMDMDGSNQHQITYDPGHENCYPDWSPDGSKIIFTKYEGSKSHLWMINADGSYPTQLTAGDSYNDLADWHANGNITYRSTRSGNFDIWILEPGEGLEPFAEHVYGDDGVYTVTLTVTDDQNLSASDTCNVTVQNVEPNVIIQSISMDVEIGLRVAGRKYNNVSMTLYEDDSQLGYVSIERLPGSPNEQMAWIPVSINFSKSYNATVTYTPEDPPNVGGNPVWIYIKSKDGTMNKIHHTFNVQQSKKRDSDHWNHVEPWEVDLNAHFIGLPFEITSHITDPGSDDETLTFTYGSQVKTVIYLNNPPNLDPYPSSEINPVDIIDTTILIYEGNGTITLVVKDDDNIRLGVGEGIDLISVG